MTMVGSAHDQGLEVSQSEPATVGPIERSDRAAKKRNCEERAMDRSAYWLSPPSFPSHEEHSCSRPPPNQAHTSRQR